MVNQTIERKRFVILASDGCSDPPLVLSVTHTLGDQEAAVEAIRSAIVAWLTGQRDKNGRLPKSLEFFTWSHYLDYCDEITVTGVTAVVWERATWTVDVEENLADLVEEAGDG